MSKTRSLRTDGRTSCRQRNDWQTSSISSTVIPAAYASPMIAPELVPQMTAGRIAARSSTRRTPMCARPSAPPPPRARPMRVTAYSVAWRENVAHRSLLPVFEDVASIRFGTRLARATVSLGDSPNNVRYWPAKRLRCQKPKSNAARVTGSRANGPSRSLRSHLAQRRDAQVSGRRHTVAVAECVAHSSFGDTGHRAQIAQRHSLVLHARRVLHACPDDAQAGGAHPRRGIPCDRPSTIAAEVRRSQADRCVVAVDAVVPLARVCVGRQRATSASNRSSERMICLCGAAVVLRIGWFRDRRLERRVIRFG